MLEVPVAATTDRQDDNTNNTAWTPYVKETLNALEAEGKRRNVFLQKHQKEAFVAGSRPLLPRVLGEIKLPAMGDVSAGKSSIINAVCKYPILPAAKTVTSACPVEVRYAEAGQESLEVAPINRDDIYAQTKPCYVYNGKKQLDSNLFSQLYDYARELGSKEIIVLGDTLNLFKETNPEYLGTQRVQSTVEGMVLDRTNPRHTMFLLMLLLATYVGQDMQEDDLSTEEAEVLKKRSSLMNALGIPTNIAYVIRLYWHSDQIPEGTVIVDLPGLGADTKNGNGQLVHDQQVDAYTTGVPCLMFVVNTTGTITNKEAREKLNLFIAQHSGKASSARLLFVMNKADLLGISPEYDDVDAAVKSIFKKYAQLKDEYAKYSMYAISARAGELFFTESGLPLDNLHSTVHQRRSIMKGKNSNERAQEAQDIAEEALRYQYPCRTASGEFIKMDLPTFIRRYFSEQVGRLRLLQATEELEQHFGQLDTWASKLQKSLSGLDLVENFSEELRKDVQEITSKSVEETITQASATLSKAERSMDFMIALAGIRVYGELMPVVDMAMRKYPEWKSAAEKELKWVREHSSIMHSFRMSYQSLSHDINVKFRDVSKNLEAKAITHKIPLDDESDAAKSRRNRERLRAFAAEIAELPFSDYFTDSFNRLDNEFDTEFEQYKDAINEIIGVLDHAPDALEQRIAARFDSLWEKAKKTQAKDVDETELKAYKEKLQEGYYAHADDIKNLMRSLFNELISNIQKDTRMRHVFSETSDQIRSNLNAVLNPYIRNSYASDIIKRITKNRWLRANTVDRDKLEAFLKADYIPDFEKHFKYRLTEVISGGNNIQGHAQRQNAALSEFKNDYLSESATKSIQSQLVCDGIGDADDALNVPAAELCKPLVKAAKEMEAFFAKDSVYALLTETLVPKFQSIEWAKGSLQHVAKQADGVKTTLSKITRTYENV